jgi:hypothetical protein
MNDQLPAKIPLLNKRLGLLAFIVLILTILAYKAYDEGWFLPRTPLVLNGQPTVLIFNRHKGCDCALVVYHAAARQIREWPEAHRQGVQLIQIDLDRRPDLGAQFDVIRAPSLLLLDRGGSTRYRQDDVVTDLEPLNLPLLEQRIQEVIHGN